MWFSKNLILVFDSSEFNNLITPSAAILSLAISVYALRLANRQNKMITSQNARALFEIRIASYINEMKKEFVIESSCFESEKITPFNYIAYLKKVLKSIAENDDYKMDFAKFKHDDDIPKEHFKGCSYQKELQFLALFVSSSPSWCLKVKWEEKLKLIINEINASDLLESDKFNLKQRIKMYCLYDYLEFVKELEQAYPIKIPMLFEKTTAFKSLQDTAFTKNHSYFRSELELV